MDPVTIAELAETHLVMAYLSRLVMRVEIVPLVELGRRVAVEEQGQPESVAVLVMWAASSVLPEGRPVEQLVGRCVGRQGYHSTDFYLRQALMTQIAAGILHRLSLLTNILCQLEI